MSTSPIFIDEAAFYLSFKAGIAYQKIFVASPYLFVDSIPFGTDGIDTVGDSYAIITGGL